MKRFSFLFLSLSLLLPLMVLPGCTYTQAVSQTNIPMNRQKPVQASIDKFIFLGFNFDNDFALQLTQKLKERCPGGAVRGVTTQDKTTLYFLHFFWSREVTAQGYCVPQKATAAQGGELDSVLSRTAASPAFDAGADADVNANVNADVDRSRRPPPADPDANGSSTDSGAEFL